MDLVSGVDVLVHDALLSADELPGGAAGGHAAAEYAVSLGEAAGVGTVVLFHHSHRRTDAMLDMLADRYRDHPTRVMVAAEGTVLDL
jgi:ribonuclease BN (tRNA processing enzyme)